MALSDTKAVRRTATGTAGVGPARIRGLILTSTGTAGRLTVTDGNGGATVLDVDIIASGTQHINTDGNGIKVNDLWISAFTNLVGVTFFYS